jgi:hypothetical protein
VSARQEADEVEMGAGFTPPMSALAGQDDMVGYGVTPMFDQLVAEQGEDPRGYPVKDWKEFSYVGGKHGRGDEGVPAARSRVPGEESQAGCLAGAEGRGKLPPEGD